MKRIICILLCLAATFSLAACETQVDRDYAQLVAEIEADPIPQDIRPDLDWETNGGKRPKMMALNEPMLTPAPGDDLRGTLKIKMNYWYGSSNLPNIALLAEEFKQLHPYVNIVFDFPEDYLVSGSYTASESAQRRAAAREKVSVDLMCRTADYILYDPTMTMGAFCQLSRNGLFIDLMPYLERDPDISPDDFFPGVLDAGTVDGQLTLVPYAFCYDCVYMNRSVLDEIGVDPEGIETVSTTQMLDWYEQARKAEPDLQIFFGGNGKDQLFPSEMLACMDLDRLTASFDSPGMIDFLTRSGDVINEELSLDYFAQQYMGMVYGPVADDILRWQSEGKPPSCFAYCTDEDYGLTKLVKNARRAFATVEGMVMPNLGNLQYPLEYMAGPYPLVNTAGQLRITTRDSFAVPACHPDPELAWAFIKYCMSERDNMTVDVDVWYAENNAYTNYIPANRANFRKMAAWLPEYVTRSYLIGFTRFDPIDVDILQAGLDLALSQKMVNRLPYDLSMDDYLDEFYGQELTTPEECAKKMQGRAEIWLNE